MNRATFEILVNTNTVQQYKVLRGLTVERTPIHESILMGLWIIFNKDTLCSCGLNFETAQSSGHLHYKNLIQILCEIGGRYVKWPHAQDRQHTSQFYEERFGFPGVIGAIDGTLVPITAPREQKQRYVDKNHNYSINVMLTYDHKRLIRDAFVGQLGSIHDSRIFRRSPLAQCLHSRDDMLSEGEHLVGDSGYVLTDKMTIPYRNDGHLVDSHRNINHLLAQCRASIERCNGLLKMRMQRTGKLFCKSINTTVMHLGACIVLHNFILLEGQEIDGMEIGEVPHINAYDAINAAREAGIQKRNNIRHILDERMDQYND
ncbi:Protein ANTAGONIST OF LIKE HETEROCHROMATIN PROTEIN 1 [Frankliniella fusca]|uniref:Protein ANTAGONIST OF LIKE HETEROCHROMATIN PROTEIN 1 n=1 Tax=Frankliniella fusca TaxID=407009 RepID=A0AAE1LHQ1_9NEOP|nr:Protein ANTAGONIST OF LIKE HETEROCHROMATIN PROTEIN 1 [Frankliniella fusca]